MSKTVVVRRGCNYQLLQEGLLGVAGESNRMKAAAIAAISASTKTTDLHMFCGKLRNTGYYCYFLTNIPICKALIL